MPATRPLVAVSKTRSICATYFSTSDPKTLLNRSGLSTSTTLASNAVGWRNALIPVAALAPGVML
ncbi:hypothetical protein [Mycolicibacterium sp.]|uniref:hypothetical protein n=1 Tax=Mycolicibacterium sp. TaxID=2320850 RepID=UPI003D0A01C1